MKSSFLLVLAILISTATCAQHSAAVDFKKLNAEISIYPSKKAVSGKIMFKFDILEAVDSIFIDARKMAFSDVLLNGKKVNFGSDQNKFWITGNFSPAQDQQLQLKYSATPGQTLYFISKKPEAAGQQDYQVWTQGQGKYTSNWLPSFDDTSEKLEFDLTYIYPSGKMLISNGSLVASEKINDTLTRWEFDMMNPMSSYLVAMAAGDFKEVRHIENDIPMIFYYPEGMEERVEPTYRHTGFMMDFFQKETGVAYPWQNYKQIPVRDFLYSGMENTGTTIFSDIFLVDSIGYHDQNYVNVNAHELAHQWFGNLVTAAFHEDHWLQEGFATYYALLAEKEIFGEDYYYRKLFKTAEELKELSDRGKGEAVAAKNGSSLTYYQKGAWALHILNEKIGKTAFDTGVKNFLEKHKYSTATTQDLIDEMEAASGQDLSGFVNDWLKQSAFQGTQALESLRKSPFIQKYLALAAVKPLPVSEKRNLLLQVLSFPVNDYLGQEAVLQLALEDTTLVSDLYKKAFSSGNLYTRQAIAFTLQNVPQQLKPEYESLLNDASYLTQEMTLYNLWMSFPEDRAAYLRKMANTEGFLDKNIRTLWLTLALATPGFEMASKNKYIEELRSYTAPHSRFQVRERAFGFLYQLNAFDEQSLANLKDATTHPNYRFREFAKELLKTLQEAEGL
ncbi:M1 family metallopeptidase [Salinimicrobium sp. MT39]|uniref:Aminopeptidase N n=1 Tax=Salinimicrobium profundisediminis TaxID=2994553 RepID=A0A9X3CVK6_9FLAO|nr:M1 family metallopeptidase [Salinimicrobium profundisediminis]MCX2837672.1 M1 family metallopeptidase [Salinimicrobium profundisediminis]